MALLCMVSVLTLARIVVGWYIVSRSLVLFWSVRGLFMIKVTLVCSVVIISRTSCWLLL